MEGYSHPEDFGLPHLKISESLGFVGVQLQATWQKTRKENNDESVARLKSCIGSWKSGKFMPLVCRPFSVNSYALSKIWFRTHCVDLRAGDIRTMESLCKSFIYQDMFEKPSELVLHRRVEHGGLGLHHIQSKALASLIATFIQTAANPKFQQSLYHNCLYRWYCLGDETILKPDIPPYYSLAFFSKIKKVIQESPLNPIQLSVKQCYKLILEEDVTMEYIEAEGRLVAKKTRVETLVPDNNWEVAYNFSRLKGLSTESRSFNFKLLQQLLPVNERLHQLLPNNRSVCTLCQANVPESLLHALFTCEKNSLAGEALLSLTRPYDRGITAEKALLLKLDICDPIYELPTVLVLSTGLNLIWRNRTNGKGTALYQVRAELECLISLLRRSRRRRLREAGDMICNTLANF